MDAAAFDQIYESFRQFHHFWGSALGRKQWQVHSRHYLQALREQSQARRNAENLSEAVAVSARALQRFLTDARWDDGLVIGRLQADLGARLTHAQAVWVLHGSDFPKQGLKSVGVARQYCGSLGKIANWQAGLFLAHVGPQGRALVDKRLYLPAATCVNAHRCDAAHVPATQRRYQAKTDLALEMLVQAQARGHLGAPWVAADAAFGMSPSFREGVAAAGLGYVLDVSPQMTVWPRAPTWTDPPYQGLGRPRTPKLRRGQRRTVAARSLALPPDAWQELTVTQGAQGPRTYRCSAERIHATSRRKPGAEVWAFYRQHLDGSEPRTYLSNAPPETPMATLAYVGGSRWRIETEFETGKNDVGMDEYETRTWPGWHHHIAMCLLANAFLLSLQQAWGEKDAPDHAPAGVSGRARDPTPGMVRAGRADALAAGGSGAQRECETRPSETPRRLQG